jgi:hypothetical protein
MNSFHRAIGNAKESWGVVDPTKEPTKETKETMKSMLDWQNYARNGATEQKELRLNDFQEIQCNYVRTAS